MEQQKGKKHEHKVDQAPYGHMSVLISNGKVEIDAHCQDVEYQFLMALLNQGGIELDIQVESWCG